MIPSVGRIVHYRSYGSLGGKYLPECRAAIITGVVDNLHLHLAVLNPEGMFFNQNVPHNEVSKSGGSWHWPERVPTGDEDHV